MSARLHVCGSSSQLHDIMMMMERCYTRLKPIAVDGGFLVAVCARFSGNNKRPFQLIVGPDYQGLCFTYLMILLPSTLFLFILAPHMHRAVSLVTLSLLVVNVFSLSFTACTDPGVVRREESHEELESGGESVSLVDCHACNMMRPRNARHCYRCDVCVIELDHHCPWIGKCIGKRTLLSFRVFVVSLGLLAYFMMGCTVFWSLSLAKKGGSSSEEISLVFAERLPWPINKPVLWVLRAILRIM